MTIFFLKLCYLQHACFKMINDEAFIRLESCMLWCLDPLFRPAGPQTPLYFIVGNRQHKKEKRTFPFMPITIPGPAITQPSVVSEP